MSLNKYNIRKRGSEYLDINGKPFKYKGKRPKLFGEFTHGNYWGPGNPANYDWEPIDDTDYLGYLHDLDTNTNDYPTLGSSYYYKNTPGDQKLLDKDIQAKSAQELAALKIGKAWFQFKKTFLPKAPMPKLKTMEDFRQEVRDRMAAKKAARIAAKSAQSGPLALTRQRSPTEYITPQKEKKLKPNIVTPDDKAIVKYNMSNTEDEYVNDESMTDAAPAMISARSGNVASGNTGKMDKKLQWIQCMMLFYDHLEKPKMLFFHSDYLVLLQLDNRQPIILFDYLSD